MARQTGGFRTWVGTTWHGFTERVKQARQARAAALVPAQPKDEQGQAVPNSSLAERLEARFEDMMREVDDLSNDRYGVEEHAEYGWIVAVRFLLPIVFFIGFGYEDGLFMTGFRYLSWEPFILLMYAIGYGLEALRVAMVYSMNFSRVEGRAKAFRWQLIFWLIMSVGCGVAQLASAMVIQALGADTAITGNNAVAQGAHAILQTIPWLVFLAIAIRVGLCAIADVACSGFLHKRKQTVEQKVAQITTRASNLVTLVQTNITAQSMVDNAQQFQHMVADQRQEVQELRAQQKQVFNTVFQVGMKQVYRITEEAESKADDGAE